MPFRPDKSFFEQEERSKTIRALCIEAVAYIKDYIENPEIEVKAMDREILRQSLEAVVLQLKELGIYARMNEGLELEVYMHSPVIAAEWLAGTMLNTLSKMTELPNIGMVFTDYEHKEIGPLITHVEERNEGHINMTVLRNQIDIVECFFQYLRKNLIYIKVIVSYNLLLLTISQRFWCCRRLVAIMRYNVII